MSAPPDIIVFDFGGVVGQRDFPGLTKKVQKSLCVSRSHAKDFVKMLEKHKAAKKGDISFWNKFQMKLGRDLPMGWSTQYTKMREESLRIHPEIAKIIRELKKQGCKVALLSNVSADRARSLKKLGLYKPFSPALLSCFIKADKPRAKAYKILLKKLGKVSPERCFFIDDKKENVKAALRLGIRAVRFTSTKRLRWDLELHGILPPRQPSFKPGLLPIF